MQSVNCKTKPRRFADHSRGVKLKNMDKGKHLHPKDYDQIIAKCMGEPDFNITEYLESQFLEHSQANNNFMQGIEEAFDREESNPIYDNIKMVIQANNGQVSDPRIDKLKIIAIWGENKKQSIELEHNIKILKKAKQGLSKIEKGLFELENQPDFKSMFVIDPTPCEVKKGESYTSVCIIEKQHRFNISNRQTVDESGIIIRDNYFRYYISELILLLSERLKASEISDFLNYHYSQSTNKASLLNFICCDLWDYFSEPIKDHRKEAILQWADKISTQKDSTQPEGLQCIEGIKNEDLKFIFSKLIKSSRLHKSVTESNFVSTFQAGALPVDWKPNKWIGNNTELATLINQLTGLRPMPSIVKPLFQTNKEYENVSSSRITHPQIMEVVVAALK